MITFRLILLLPLLLMSLAGRCSMGQPEDPSEADYAILFVGNSLTYVNDLPGVLRDLLEKESDFQNVFVESIAKPNYGLQDHWAEQATKDRITGQPWDIVIMQQGPSATEGRPSLIEFTTAFAELIRQTGAEPALYMVWPEEARRFDFTGVRSSYLAAADSVDGYFFPAGAAWQEAWEIDSELELYGPDRFHPSQLGTYLAAAVMFEQITGTRAPELNRHIGTKYGPIRLEPSVGEKLHDAARSANRQYARPK